MRSARDVTFTVLLVAVTLVWGSAFSGIKLLVAYLSPLDVARLRFAVAGVGFLGLWLHFKGRWRRDSPMDSRQALRMFALGALGVVVYHGALNWGEAVVAASASGAVAASLASLLVATTPIFTMLLAIIILKERVTLRRALGVFVAFMGVTILVVWGRGVRMGPEAMGGALIILLAPISWALYSILVKRELGQLGPLQITTYSMLAGTLLLGPTIDPVSRIGLGTMPASAWLWVVWLGLVATFAGYVIWNLALVHWPATRVAAFVYLVPFFGILWAVILVDERLTWQLFAGGALILLGVWLASRRRPVAAIDPPAARA
jgi:drug/metabolite transporter (DMT)-like permease